MDYESLKIVSNIFIAFIGSGVLGLPYAFKRSGLLEGAFVMAIVAYFSTRAMLLLIDCQYKVKSVLQGRSSIEMNGNSRTATNEADSNQTQHDKPNGFGDVFTGVTVNRDKTDAIRQREPFPEKDDSPESSESEEDPFVKVESNRRLISNGDSNGTKKSKTSSNRLNNNQEIITYSDVAFAAWGDIGRFVIDGSLICAQVGFCCGYLIFITENLSNYFTSVNKTSWLVFLLPPLFFLTLIPDLRKLAIFSLMAQVSNLMAFAVVYWFDFEHLHLASAANRKEISLKGFPFFFCAAVYCFEGAGMVIALEQSVPTDRRKQFKKYFVATIGTTELCIIYLYSYIKFKYWITQVDQKLYFYYSLHHSTIYIIRSFRLPIIWTRNKRHYHTKPVVRRIHWHHQFRAYGENVSMYFFVLFVPNYDVSCDKNASKKMYWLQSYHNKPQLTIHAENGSNVYTVYFSDIEWINCVSGA